MSLTLSTIVLTIILTITVSSSIIISIEFVLLFNFIGVDFRYKNLLLRILDGAYVADLYVTTSS